MSATDNLLFRWWPRLEIDRIVSKITASLAVANGEVTHQHRRTLQATVQNLIANLDLFICQLPPPNQYRNCGAISLAFAEKKDRLM
jgi:hypothetical protein